MILIVLSWCLLFTGCGKNVDSFTTFSIQGFEEFYDFHTTSDVRKMYIREGKMEFARLNEFYVCPFIKEINYDECALFFYVYTLEDECTEIITISDIVLSSNKEETFLYTNSSKQSVLLERESEDILVGKISDIEFKKTDSWFFNDNTLKLVFRVECGEEYTYSQNFSYDIRIICNERAKMPT